MIIFFTFKFSATACTKIGEFKNGMVTYHPDNLFGSQLVYDCDPGYTLVGNKIRICEGDGWWSGTSPVCTKESKYLFLSLVLFI